MPAKGSAYGSPGNPISDAELVAKFLDCATYAAAPRDATIWRSLADRILALESAGDVALAIA
jgi:hypothetical protein